MCSAVGRQRLAVVTGAGKGLGEALVHELSAAGWLVLAVVRQAVHAEALGALTGVQTLVHDVRSDDMGPVLEALQARPVDVLINNAAQGAPHQPLGSVEADGVLNAVNVNVAGPLRMVQAMLPNLLEAAHPVIVNVTSRLGSMSAQARGDYADLSTSYAYRISKAAQNMLTVSLAHDLQGKIHCWAVHPGKLATDMGQADAVSRPGVTDTLGRDGRRHRPALAALHLTRRGRAGLVASRIGTNQSVPSYPSCLSTERSVSGRSGSYGFSAALIRTSAAARA